MRKVPYHPVNDFDCILQYSVYQYGLVVRAGSPWKTLKDLIAYAQANPNKVKYSTARGRNPATPGDGPVRGSGQGQMDPHPLRQRQ